jgi:hypothetical protein
MIAFQIDIEQLKIISKHEELAVAVLQRELDEVYVELVPESRNYEHKRSYSDICFCKSFIICSSSFCECCFVLLFYFIWFVSQNLVPILIDIVLNSIKFYWFRVLQVGMR